MIRGFVLALPLLIAFALPAQASFFGRVFGSPPTIVEEEDGSPSLSGRTIRFPNDSLTDQGGGVVSVNVASVADVAAVSASTAANRALIDLNTTQLTTVALDTTTIAGDVVANTARADQAAISTTTHASLLAEVSIDTATHAADGGAHGATDSAGTNTIVRRDAGGNFAAGIITADSFNGLATFAAALNANGGNCSAGAFPAGVDASGAAENCQINLSGTADFANDFATTPSICSSGQAPRGIATDGDALNCTDYETPAEVAASFADFNTAPGSFTILGAGGLLVVDQIRIAPFTSNTSTIASDGTSQWAGNMTVNGTLGIGIAPLATLDLNISGAQSGRTHINIKNTDTAATGDIMTVRDGNNDIIFQITTLANNGQLLLYRQGELLTRFVAVNQSGAGSGFNFMAHSAARFGLRNKDPKTVLDVTGNAQFGDGVTKTTMTAAGGVEIGGTLTISGGTSIVGHLSATASLDFGATSANTCDDLTVTVTGAADGDTCALGVLNALASGANTSLTCFVSAADTVTVRRCNSATGAAADPASATVRATVWKH